MRKIFWTPVLFAAIGALSIGHASGRQQNTEIPIEIAKAVVDRLAAEDFCAVTEKFESTLKQALTTEKIQEGWASLIARTGSFKRQISTESQKSPEGYDIILVKCEFEKSAGLVRVIFDHQNKVVGLWVTPAPNSTTVHPIQINSPR